MGIRNGVQSGMEIRGLAHAPRPGVVKDGSVAAPLKARSAPVSNKPGTVTMLPASPVRTAALLIAIIFGAELAIMFLFSLTGADAWMPKLIRDFSDAILLSLTAAILIYYLIVIPQQRMLEYVERINRLVYFLSYINRTARKQRDSHALFNSACAAAMHYGGFRFAWIGLFETDSDRMDVVAMEGADEACMQAVHAAGTAHCGVAVQVLEKDKPACCHMSSTGDCDVAWREILLRYGCRSCAVFPLHQDDSVVGVFAVYAGNSGFFHDDEMHILEEAAGDISFALTSIKQARMRTRATRDLQDQVDELERFRKATVEREFRIKELRDEVARLKQKDGASKENTKEEP